MDKMHNEINVEWKTECYFNTESITKGTYAVRFNLKCIEENKYR